MNDFEFDTDVPISTGRRKSRITLLSQAMPVGASKWFLHQHEATSLYASIRRIDGYSTMIRAEEKDGVSGWRVWKIEKKVKP